MEDGRSSAPAVGKYLWRRIGQPPILNKLN
jgi:hypothetical protein